MKYYIKISLFLFFLASIFVASFYFVPDLMWMLDYYPDYSDLEFLYGHSVGIIVGIVFSSGIAGFFAFFDFGLPFLFDHVIFPVINRLNKKKENKE